MSKAKANKQTKSKDESKKEVLDCKWEEMHGFRGNKEWAAPRLAVYCDAEARPGYNTKLAHEYLDTEEVLAEKIKMLAEMIRMSNSMLAYTGAGISTGAGIGDYATKAGDKSVALQGKPKLKSNLDALPTLAHRTFTALYKAGYLKGWIQQNHDGLPQKAGFPQYAINEIHGAWFDPSNAVVPMSGSLRDDLFANLLEWEEKTDLCIAVGTSLSGMNADRVVETVGEKALADQDNAIGAVIVGIQCTRLDNVAALRIFAKIDQVFELLAKELDLVVPEYKQYEPDVPKDMVVRQDVFRILFNEKGKPSKDASILDLRPGKYVRITGGMHKGDYGMVLSKNAMGHYKIMFKHAKKEDVTIRLLGSWWVEAGVNGQGVVPNGLFPVVSVEDNKVPDEIVASIMAHVQ